MNKFRFTIALIVWTGWVCTAQDRGKDADSNQLRVDAWITFGKKQQWVDPHRALNYADSALAKATEIHYESGKASAHNLRGFCYWSLGDNELAVQSAMEALEIIQRHDQPSIAAESYYILARGYMDVGEGEKAMESIQLAEQLATDGGDWEQVASIYNLKGVIFFVGNRKDSALYYYTKAFDAGKQHAIDPINFPRIISNIGECYLEDDPNRAFDYWHNALALAEETNNQIAKASITSIIGHANLGANDLKSAETNLQSALRLAQSLGLRRVVRHVYAGLVDIRLKQGKGEEAVVYLRRYYDVHDSLLNASKIRQIVELEAKHTLELKEQNIRMLEKEKRIQTLWTNLLIISMIFVILISVGFYRVLRYRHRKNREMLHLELDYLTRRHKETEEKFKASLVADVDEPMESLDQKLLKQAISVVENHISDPRFGVEEMAAEMNMSRANLHRKIKAVTGFPPSELIRSIRLRKAERMILNRVDSVTQIALLVGFDDYPHFSKSFKKYFGVSPTSYLEQFKSANQGNQ